MLGGQAEIFVHVEDGDAAPIHCRCEKRGERLGLRRCAGEDDAGRAVALDGCSDGLRRVGSGSRAHVGAAGGNDDAEGADGEFFHGKRMVGSEGFEPPTNSV